MGLVAAAPATPPVIHERPGLVATAAIPAGHPLAGSVCALDEAAVGAPVDSVARVDLAPYQPVDPALIRPATPADLLPHGARGLLVPWTGVGPLPAVGSRVDVWLPAPVLADRAVIGSTGDGLVVVATADEARDVGDLWASPDRVAVIVTRAAPTVPACGFDVVRRIVGASRWPQPLPGGYPVDDSE
jgi:hypothetical protein